MEKFLFSKFSSVILFCLVVSFAYSQSEKNSDYYIWFDSVIGDGNTKLYNGARYLEKYRVENEKHNFFLSKNYLIGNLIYDGQAFYKVYMKYDTYLDNLIVRLPNQSAFLFIKLVKEKVHSFSLFGLNFINAPIVKKHDIESSTHSFYRVLKETPTISLYKKHYTILNENIEGFKVFSEFRKKEYYVIKYKGNYLSIDSRKDFIRLFPNFKKQISSHYKKERKLSKSNRDDFYINLIKKINLLMVENNNS